VSDRHPLRLPWQGLIVDVSAIVAAVLFVHWRAVTGDQALWFVGIVVGGHLLTFLRGNGGPGGGGASSSSPALPPTTAPVARGSGLLAVVFALSMLLGARHPSA
jgi:hypothetical protein